MRRYITWIYDSGRQRFQNIVVIICSSPAPPFGDTAVAAAWYFRRLTGAHPPPPILFFSLHRCFASGLFVCLSLVEFRPHRPTLITTERGENEVELRRANVGFASGKNTKIHSL
ncbi:hypothetical protein B0I72DRAFT_8014 [Yarrowia lipolytica]|nr:hypothetical protein B0I72DRAFT_8014 [Yarrowia lipolytica]RDW39781.1 hypothetical protein B0I73DRAFT_31591 [Yarrowia lipolytica]RDW47163.1 hypothetical protein B0I74DRAFT_21356 [Yarrowia lipolytica]RDW53390.1 hypothetical protein B0I75DRAFT_23193 [Yarrowia lipolytica]